MKLVVLKNNLEGALIAVERAVGASSTLPALRHILLSVTEPQVMVSATNLEFAVQAVVSGKVIERGECSIPAATFIPIIKNLTSERVTLEWRDRILAVTTDNYEANVPGGDPGEFPLIPPVHPAVGTVTLDAGMFWEGLNSVIGSAQYSEVRPEISGVSLALSPDQLTFVATDSFRLAEYSLPAGHLTTTIETFSIIIPLRAAEEILRIFAGAPVPLTITIDQSQLLVATPERRMVTRLIDGVFPNYQPIIPREVSTEVTIPRQDLVSGIKLASTLAGRTNDLTVSASEKGHHLELGAGDGTLGEGRCRISAKVRGGACSIVFNWKYLADGIRLYQGAEVVLGMNAVGPALVTSPSEPRLRYVVMPIRS